MATVTSGKVVSLIKANSYQLKDKAGKAAPVNFVRGVPQLITDAKILKRLEAINESVGTPVFKLTDPARTPKRTAAKK